MRGETTMSELRNYENWKNKNPVDIRQAVVAAGGWANVFPLNMTVARYTEVKIGPYTERVPIPEVKTSAFPEWASRVRGFFNVTPVTLERLPPLDGYMRTSKHRGVFALIPASLQQLVFALNGDVYVDEHGRPWFDMIKPGTVYHFPGKVGWEKIASAMVHEVGNVPMPIFKLISPDGTGGSMEVCLHNGNRANTIGKVGETVAVSPRLVKDEVFRGSYNYAETVVRGLVEHDYRDIKPHREDKGFYVSPPTYSAIGARRFPPILSNYNPVTGEWK
jgi:hypothetical protein